MILKDAYLIETENIQLSNKQIDRIKDISLNINKNRMDASIIKKKIQIESLLNTIENNY